LLIIFKHFEVFFLKLEHLDVGALVEIELELDVLPDFVELGKSLFHFGLLTGLVGNFFNIFLVLVQVKVVDIS